MKSAAALLLIVIVLAPGCTTRVKNYECVVPSDGSPADPAAMWECNRKIIERAVRGKKFTLRELEQASQFFEEVTGIPADLRYTGFGPIPGDDLRNDLAAWDDWYENHSGRLYWEDGEVRAGS